MLKKYFVILLLFTLVALTCKVQMDPQLEEHLEIVSAAQNSDNIEQEDVEEYRFDISFHSPDVIIFNNSFEFQFKKIGQEKINSFYILNNSNNEISLTVDVSNISDFETSFVDIILPPQGMYIFYVKFAPINLGLRYMEITLTDTVINETFTMYFQGECVP